MPHRVNEYEKQPPSVDTSYLKPLYKKEKFDHRPSAAPTCRISSGGQGPEPFQPRLLDRAEAGLREHSPPPGLLILKGNKSK